MDTAYAFIAPVVVVLLVLSVWHRRLPAAERDRPLDLEDGPW